MGKHGIYVVVRSSSTNNTILVETAKFNIRTDRNISCLDIAGAICREEINTTFLKTKRVSDE
jgi:hypothetical protein